MSKTTEGAPRKKLSGQVQLRQGDIIELDASRALCDSLGTIETSAPTEIAIVVSHDCDILRCETCKGPLDKFEDVELGLVQIGNLGRVGPVERLPEQAHCLESIAFVEFVEFCLQHRNTGINQSVLDMREPSSGICRQCPVCICTANEALAQLCPGTICN
jgi:hypothetical protein